MTNRIRRPGPTLEELVARYRATRDPGDLGRAFDLAAPGLFRLAVAFSPDAASAEDAVQETFLAAFEDIDAWDERRPVGPWLAGILRHKAARARRRARRAPEPLAVVPSATGTCPVGAAERREETERIRAAIARLGEPYRSVALLRWRHGLTPADIAEVRGEPPGTVRSTLTRALARLRRDLGGLAAFAFFAPGAGERSPSGLAHVRRGILRRLARHGAVASAGALALGGILMITKKQFALTSAAALLLGAGWFARTCGDVASVPAASPRHDPAETPAARVRAEAERTPERDATAAAEPSPTPPAGDVLRGRVVSRSGDPVPGARVAAFRASIEDAVDPASERTATSGADGAFTIGGLAGAPPYVLAAEARGFAPRTRTGARPGDDVTIVLGSPAAFEGRVLGEGGAPIAGARVRVRGVLAGGARFDAAATSGGDGEYRVAGLPPIERRHTSPDGTLAVEATADGYAPLLVADVLDVGPQAVPDLGEGRATRLDLHMVRGAVLTGRVSDASGRPVEGARVALISYERPPAIGRFAERPRDLGSTTSAADGTFRFDAVPAAGVHRPAILGDILPFGAVAAVGPGGSTGAVALPVLRDGESRPVEIVLAPVAWVTGRVVDESGAPVAGAAVSARSATGRPIPAPLRSAAGIEFPCPYATSGADGRFRAAVPLRPDAGTRLLVGVATAAAGRTPCRAGEIGVAIDPSGTTGAGDVVVRAEPAGVHADVTVVDASGRPVADAAFRTRDELHIPGSAWGWPATDAEGCSRLTWRRRGRDDVPAGAASREVVVTSPGFAPTVADVVFESAARDPQRIELAPGRHVEGRVRWSDGRPASDAWILVSDAAVPLDEAIPDAGSQRAPPDRHPAVPGLVVLGLVHAEADGTFRVDDLPDRALHVVARTESMTGPGGRNVETSRCALRDVRTGAEDLVLVLPRPETGAARAAPLDVRIVDDATGRPLAGAKAELFDGEFTVLYGTSVGEGRVRFDAVPPGVWTLLAASPRFGRTIVAGVRTGDSSAEREVRVAQGAVVTGRIDGVGSAGLVHLVRDDASSPWFWQPAALLGTDGTFSMEGVAAGRYRVVVSASSDPAHARDCADALVVRPGDKETRFATRALREGAGR